MAAALDDMDAQTTGKGSYDVLSDNRLVTEPITPEQLRTLMSHVRVRGTAAHGGRCAVVVSSDASYGMMRMMGVYAEQFGIEVEAFRTMDEAAAFLAQ